MNSLVSITYQHYYLELKKDELASFLEYFRQSNAVTHLKEDGEQRLVFTCWQENTPGELTINLENCHDYYIIHQTMQPMTSFLEEIVRNSINQFRASAIIEHQFLESVMLYYYENGIVHKILEKTPTKEKTIYHFPSMIPFTKNINVLRQEINTLLDKRNNSQNQQDIPQIDQQLKRLAYQMKRNVEH